MSEVNLHETRDAAIWAKEFCKRWPSAMCMIPGKEGVQGGEEFEAIMIGWFANAIMTGVDSVIAERDALKAAQIDAIRAALGEAEKSLRLWQDGLKSHGHLETARFIGMAANAILAIDPAAIAARLKGDGDEK